MEKTHSKDITVIITAFNSERIIDKCLDSIDGKYNIIVVENSNNLKFKEEIEKKYKNVKCIISGSNLGYGKANNIGIFKSKTNYVLILNPDTQLFPDTLDKLMEASSRLKNFAILAPTNLKEKHSENLEQIEVEENQSQKIKYKDIENSVDDVKGFAMFLKKDEFDDIGFFDENFFIYFEEIDLCKRAILKEKKIYKILDAKVNHIGASSHDKSINFEMELSRNWHWMWSTFYYHKKHSGYFIALLKISRKFISSLIKSFFFFLIFKRKKSKIYKQRMLGLFNSMIGKKSWYRPKINGQEN